MASNNKWIQGNLHVSDDIYEDGHSLSETYAAKSHDHTSMVHKSGTEKITGNKTFTGISKFNNNAEFNYINIKSNWDSYGEINSKKAIWNNGIILDGTLDLHPEGNPVIFPYYMNDLAYLIKKGGSCAVKYRPENGTNWSTMSAVNIESLFDGTSSYTGYTVNSLNDTVVIVIKAHKTFSFNTRVGISSGSAYWRAKNIQIDMGYMADTSNFDATVDTLINAEADESGLTTTNVTTTKTWVTRARVTDYAYGTYFSVANGPMINGTPSWNIIRITLTNFNNTRSEADIAAGKQNGNRFAGVFALCFDSEGLNTTLLGRKGGRMYGNIVPYTHDTLQLGESGNRFKIGYFRNILENEYLESNYITTNGFMPKNGNGIGHIGSTDVKWNQVHSQYIYGDTLCENNIALKNKYATEYKIVLGRNTTDNGKTMCCSFLTLTFPDLWNTFYFNLTIKDSESRYFNNEYFIRGRAGDTNTNLTCEIDCIYSSNYNKDRWRIFAIQEDNKIIFYLKTIDARYCSPDVFISKTTFDGSITVETKAGTWTEIDLGETWSEQNALDRRYAPRSGGTFTGDVRFDTVSWHANVRPTTSGGGSVGGETNPFHSMWAKYYYEDGVKLEEKYVPKKSTNNAYQAIVDNSGAAFTVTAGLSNNTGQTKFKIAPSGIATINDKQIVTKDDLSNASVAKIETSDTIFGANDEGYPTIVNKSGDRIIGIGSGDEGLLDNYMYYTFPEKQGTVALMTDIPTKSSWNYDDSYVKYSAAQTLTDAQKIQARSNIGAGTSNLTLGTTSTTAAKGDHTHSVATTSANGLMSASDKTTLTALTCKSESKDIALGLTSLIGDQTVNPITANITDRSFFSKIIDLMRAGQVVTGFYLQLGNYYTFLKLFFANLEEGYENLSFEITDANDNSCVSYGINYDASNYIITFNKRDASIADALVDDNGTTYYYNSFALSSHNQASNTINAMTNYSKPTSTSAIKATDSLNTAIGKLEKALDGKGTSNFTGYTSSNKLSTDYINNKAGWTSNTGTVVGSGLTDGYFVMGNGGVNVDISTMKPTTSSTTWSTTSDVNVPTMKAISNYVTGLGYTKNAGTVTSVRVQAGTGLSSSVSTAQTGSLNTTISIASGYKLPTTDEWNAKGTSNLTLGTTATTAAKGDHTHSAATTSAAGLMSAADKTKLDTISNNYVREYSTGKNGMPGTIINNGSSIYIDSGNDSINVIGEGDEHGVSISVGDNNFVNFYQDRTEMIDAPVKIKQIQAPTASNGTTYGLGTSGQVLKSNGTSVYWASDTSTTHPTFTRGSTDFSPAYTLTAKDAGFIHTWWRCSSNLYASCNFGNVIAVSATNLFPMQKYTPGTNTSNQTTAYQKSVSSGSRSYSNNSFNAFQIPQRGDMVIDQYGCIGVIESDPTTVVSTYSVRLVWKSIKDWSCLEKGTQITLADGTYKNIEDVRQGESIMGWDFEKNEPCEAIALFADAAQADEKTTYLVLDNGEILSMTDGHTLYSKNLERYIPINDLREGDILMGKDGEDVEVVSIHWNIHTFGIRQFYHVVSSNNTYFANNTLNAIHPVDKYNWLQNRSSEVVPDEILAIFEQDKGEFDCFDFTIKNKEFLALTSKHQSTLKKHRNKIGDLKNYLTNTDYVAIKMFEGLEVDETILDIRKEKRKEINALEKEIEKIEKEYNNLLVQYSDLGEDMLLSDNARRSKYFKIACKNDNEHLDLFKKYYPLKDEAYILKEIEEGKANRPITEVIEEEESE